MVLVRLISILFLSITLLGSVDATGVSSVPSDFDKDGSSISQSLVATTFFGPPGSSEPVVEDSRSLPAGKEEVPVPPSSSSLESPPFDYDDPKHQHTELPKCMAIALYAKLIPDRIVPSVCKMSTIAQYPTVGQTVSRIKTRVAMILAGKKFNEATWPPAAGRINCQHCDPSTQSSSSSSSASSSSASSSSSSSTCTSTSTSTSTCVSATSAPASGKKKGKSKKAKAQETTSATQTATSTSTSTVSTASVSSSSGSSGSAPGSSSGSVLGSASHGPPGSDAASEDKYGKFEDYASLDLRRKKIGEWLLELEASGRVYTKYIPKYVLVQFESDASFKDLWSFMNGTYKPRHDNPEVFASMASAPKNPPKSAAKEVQKSGPAQKGQKKDSTPQDDEEKAKQKKSAEDKKRLDDERAEKKRIEEERKAEKKRIEDERKAVLTKKRKEEEEQQRVENQKRQAALDEEAKKKREEREEARKKEEQEAKERELQRRKDRAEAAKQKKESTANPIALMKELKKREDEARKRQEEEDRKRELEERKRAAAEAAEKARKDKEVADKLKREKEAAAEKERLKKELKDKERLAKLEAQRLESERKQAEEAARKLDEEKKKVNKPVAPKRPEPIKEGPAVAPSRVKSQKLEKPLKVDTHVTKETARPLQARIESKSDEQVPLRTESRSETKEAAPVDLVPSIPSAPSSDISSFSTRSSSEVPSRETSSPASSGSQSSSSPPPTSSPSQSPPSNLSPNATAFVPSMLLPTLPMDSRKPILTSQLSYSSFDLRDPIVNWKESCRLLESEIYRRSEKMTFIPGFFAPLCDVEVAPVNHAGMLKAIVDCECFEESSQREGIITSLQSQIDSFAQGLSMARGVHAALTLIPYGSYQLGIHQKDSDIDLLLLSSGGVERSDMELLFSLLSPLVTDASFIKTAYVPIIKFTINGVSVDIAFSVMPDFDIKLPIPTYLLNADDVSIRSISGYRNNYEILKFIEPSKKSFMQAVTFLKIWAKKNGVSGFSLGYLNGIALSILTARICQLYPKAHSSFIVIKFFELYSRWNWKLPIMLQPVDSLLVALRDTNPALYDLFVGPGNQELQVWNPAVRVDSGHVMPIITPAFPSKCCTHSVTKSSHHFMISKMTEACQMLSHDQMPSQSSTSSVSVWKQLISNPHGGFFAKPEQLYLQIIAFAYSEDKHQKFRDYLEVMLRQLVKRIEHQTRNLAPPAADSFFLQVPLFGDENIILQVHSATTSPTFYQSSLVAWTTAFFIAVPPNFNMQTALLFQAEIQRLIKEYDGHLMFNVKTQSQLPFYINRQ